MTLLYRNQGIKMKMNRNKVNGFLNSVNGCEKMLINVTSIYSIAQMR